MENTTNCDKVLLECNVGSQVDRTESIMGLDSEHYVGGDHEMMGSSEQGEDLEPYVGMVFESEESARIFYNAYARRVGFGSRVSRNRRSRKDGTNIARRFVCCKEGYRSKKHQHNENRVKRPRAITREGCEAMILVKKNDTGKWVVTRFVKDHNHPLLDPIQVLSLRSHRNVTDISRNLANTFDGARIGMSKMSSVFGADSNGMSNFAFIEDGRSHIQTVRKRKTSLGRDAQNVLDYFRLLKSENPAFFYGIQIDEDQSLCSVFWADVKSRMACNYFGDVVYFDTTYKTNRYEMPFVLFTGVNHHQQSTLFGCALLLDETESSYVWLFKTWLEAMSERHPVLIITDQDAAIEAAVGRVFPKTRHSFCKWRILNKASKQLPHVYHVHPTFQGEFQKCIDLTETVYEFESWWESLINRYELREDGWLQSLYNARQKWVPVYLRATFFAQIYTTQQNGSINSFFDGYVNANTTLQELVTQYERALDRLHAKELEEDVLTMHTKPNLKTKFPIEKQAGDIFTRAMFMRFQEEIFESLGYVANKVKEDGGIHTYSVVKYEEHQKAQAVTFDIAENIASCSCQMFEVSGILCRHIFKVFAVSNVMILPSHYILKRWTRNAKSGAVLDERGIAMQANCRESLTLRFNNLCKQAIRCVEEGATSVESYGVAAHVLREAWEKIVNKKAARASHIVTSACASSQGDIISVQSEPDITMNHVTPENPPQWHSWLP
ncbi:protein FAR1-RELATED SEQUENCE 5-like [Tasmannia lanceolata]|uniref:protein FAR1-RELATED SEQUENCE 5-like n=1 Tax=Tasmannia lanceolata TaxID=3420 RepID=UPI004063D6E6